MPIKKAFFSIGIFFLLSSTLFAQIQIKKWGQMPRGYTYTVEVDGNLAYFADGSAINIADVSDPNSPKIISSIVTPATVGEIIKKNNFLYIANWDAGLTIVDVTNPNNPFITGNFPVGKNAWNLFVNGNLAFLSNDYDGLRIIDVSDPFNPSEISTINTGGRVEGSFAVGSLVYFVTDNDSLLSVYDITDPANPLSAGSFNYGGVAWNVIVDGNYAFVADKRNTVHVLDVSNPAGIFEAAAIGGPAYDFSLTNNLLYVVGNEDRIYVYNVTDPLNAFEVGRIDDYDAVEIESHDIISPFDGSVTNYSFVAAHYQGFRIYQTQNLYGSFKVAELGGGYTYDVDTENGFAFVADLKFGLRTIDLSDSRHPHLAGQLPPDLTLWRVCIDGGIVYGLGGNSELFSINVSDPYNPFVISSVSVGGILRDILVANSYAYIANGTDGVRIFDVSDPASMTEAGNYNSNFDVRGVWLDGNSLFLAESNQGVRELDISNLGSISESNNIPLTNGANFVRPLSSSYMASVGWGGLDIIDLNTNASINNYGVASTVKAIDFDGRLLYMSVGLAGMQAFDLADPTSPVDMGAFNTGANARGVKVDGNFAYVADGGDGLVSFKIEDLSNNSNYGSAYFKGGRIRVLDSSPINPNANPAAYQITGSAITVEAWVFPLDLPGNGEVRTIVLRPIYPQNIGAYELRISNLDGTNAAKFDFSISGGSGTQSFASALASTTLKKGMWYHVAGAYDGSKIRIYVNGALAGETAYTGGIGAGNAGFYLGGLLGGRFIGLMDEVSLWNTTRSAAEIQSDMSAVFTGSETGLAGFWSLNEETSVNGVFPAVVDRSPNKNDLIVQDPVGFTSFKTGDAVELPPIYIGSKVIPDEAVVNKEFRFKLQVLGWPEPKIQILNAPSGVKFIGTELVWTPRQKNVGWNKVSISASNSAGTESSDLMLWVNVVPPELYTHDNGALQFRTTNRGTFGDPFFAESNGLVYNGINGLFRGALVVGNRDGRVSGYLWENDFAPSTGFNELPAGPGGLDIITQTAYFDGKAPQPMGLFVTQRVMTSKFNGGVNFVILNFTIENKGQEPLNQIQVALTSDFDIGNATNNLTGYVDQVKMMYAYEPGTDNPYFGVVLLSHPVGGAAAWFNGEPDSRDAYYKRLTEFSTILNDPKDVRNILSTQPLSLVPGASTNVTFAYVAGSNLAEITNLASVLIKEVIILNPFIFSSRDVPFDQGGKVQLKWEKSGADVYKGEGFYSLWRTVNFNGNSNSSINSEVDITPDFKGAAFKITERNGVQIAWEWLGNKMANAFDEYSATVGTLYDSTSQTNGWHQFMVAYHHNAEYYESNVVTAYSVDNIAPGKPLNLSGKYDAGSESLTLNWSNNHEKDFGKYLLYRSDLPDFDLSKLIPIAETTDTSFVDNVSGITIAYYAVVAEDIHENKSGLSDLYAYRLTGINDFTSGIPKKYSLYQNFPNPFNPSTQIRYALKEAGFVTIRLFDMLGKEVATLVNNEQSAGYHFISFDASNIAAGVYIYELNVRGKYRAVKKMILMK